MRVGWEAETGENVDKICETARRVDGCPRVGILILKLENLF
jgi:hypothetical protein